MTTLPASEIKWGERARSDYGDVAALSKSIEKYGLLHPVVIDGETNTLVAGGRRLTAMILLGWEDIPIRLLKEMTELERNEVELEENIQRKDLTWQETVKLKEKLHQLKIALHGGEWTIEDTAKSLGETPRNTQRDLSLAKDLKKFPELEREKDKRIARTNARRQNEIETRRLTTIKSGEELGTEEPADGLYHGDCRQFLSEIPSNTIDLILCDPPFGIQFDDKDRNKAYSTTYGDEFKDSIKEVMDLLIEIMEDLYRVMKPGGHMYLFYGTQHYFLVTQAIDRHFWKYNGGDSKAYYSKIPLLWIKSSQENASPYTRFSCNYESFIFIWKPGATMNELTKPHNATFHHDAPKGGDRHHPAQKPASLYKELIELSTHENELVLDPFMGSGISLKTAKELNRRIIGIEKQEEWFELAKWNINRANEFEEGEENEG